MSLLRDLDIVLRLVRVLALKISLDTQLGGRIRRSLSLRGRVNVFVYVGMYLWGLSVVILKQFLGLG